MEHQRVTTSFTPLPRCVLPRKIRMLFLICQWLMCNLYEVVCRWLDIAEEGNNDTIKPRKTKRLKWVGDAAPSVIIKEREQKNERFISFLSALSWVCRRTFTMSLHSYTSFHQPRIIIVHIPILNNLPADELVVAVDYYPVCCSRPWDMFISSNIAFIAPTHTKSLMCMRIIFIVCGMAY